MIRKYSISFATAGLLLMFAVPVMAAPVRVLGIETNTVWEYSTVPGLTNVLFTKISEAGFSSINLNDYDVLLVSETFQDGDVTVTAQSTLDALYAQKSSIASWVFAGHGIVALSEPIGTNPYAWLPVDITLGIPGVNMGNDSVSIVNNIHPVMAGLTDDGLSNWGSSSHNWFSNSGGLSILATDGEGNALTLAGEYGAGRIVLTAQDVDFHYFYEYNPEQLQLVQNSVDWVSTPVPVPGTLLLMATGLAGLAAARKRKK